ncbi:MAG TPA: hypothetical protein PL041_11925 [Melioribacteraceae bacterium]|nr:hypothetical protein [Melioribacteraceae bacterium]
MSHKKKDKHKGEHEEKEIIEVNKTDKHHKMDKKDYEKVLDKLSIELVKL